MSIPFRIPNDPTALAALDWALHAMHVGLIVFLLLGWVWRPLHKLHMLAVVIVWLCWLVLGWMAGHFGYCLLTDWHWQVKQALGETGLPRSYIDYMYQKLTGHTPDAQLVYWLTAAIMLACSVASVWVNFRSRINMHTWRTAKRRA